MTQEELEKLLWDWSQEEINKLQMDIAIFGIGGGIHHPDGTFEYKTPKELDEIIRNNEQEKRK